MNFQWSNDLIFKQFENWKLKIENSIFVITKIAINGFGRIGQITDKRILDYFPELQIAAVNDLTSKSVLEQQFQNDVVYGPYVKTLAASFFAEKDPSVLPWRDLGVEIVLECSGFFTEKEGAAKHLQAGAKRVIISAPSDTEEIPTYLLGVNSKDYNPQTDQIISMGSCTTNAVAPVAKVLLENFGIKNQIFAVSTDGILNMLSEKKAMKSFILSKINPNIIFMHSLSFRFAFLWISSREF